MDSFFFNLKTESSNDESIFLDKSINQDEEIIKKFGDSYDSLSIFFDHTPISTQKQKKKKYNKEFLSNIPLPIFECIYCADEAIASKHLVSQVLRKKYANTKDIDSIVGETITDKLIKIQMNRLINKYEEEVKNPNLLNRKRNRE